MEFLKDGNYQVRGSVRNLADEKTQETLKKAFGEMLSNMELVEVNLTNEG
jgi:hypothetical protein